MECQLAGPVGSGGAMSTTPSDNGAGFLPCRPFWRDGHLPLSSTARCDESTEIGGISRPGWHSPDGCRRVESPRCDVVVVSCWRPALALSSWRRSLRGGEQAGNRAGVPGGRTTLQFTTNPMTHAIIQAPMGPHRGTHWRKATRYAGKGGVPKQATHTRVVPSMWCISLFAPEWFTVQIL